MCHMCMSCVTCACQVQPIPCGVTFWKAQSSKLERLFCHVSVKTDVRALSFERAFENVTPSGIGCVWCGWCVWRACQECHVCVPSIWCVCPAWRIHEWGRTHSHLTRFKWKHDWFVYICDMIDSFIYVTWLIRLHMWHDWHRYMYHTTICVTNSYSHTKLQVV